MEPISIVVLRKLWENEGLHGKWRKLLRQGHKEGEIYFEFGLTPEKDRDYGCWYRIVLDHEVHVQLALDDLDKKGDFVICFSEAFAGKARMDEAGESKTFYVSKSEHDQMMSDAEEIYQLYKDDEFICFWSIPNLWFSDMPLIRFITDHIVALDYYKKLIRGHKDWYWP